MKKKITGALLGAMILCCACGNGNSDPKPNTVSPVPSEKVTPVPTSQPTPVPTETPTVTTPAGTDDNTGEKSHLSEAFKFAQTASGEQMEDFFAGNCFFGVDSEFNADTVRALYPFVGKWALLYDGEYFINETFAYRGILIYADSTWTWVNGYGVPAMTPGRVIRAEQDSITLYEEQSGSTITLLVDSEGALIAGEDTYRYSSGTDIDYPLQGTPVELLGKWKGDEGIGNFYIDRTGMVIFNDNPETSGTVVTISRDTISIENGNNVTEIGIYEAPAGILVDSLGNVYRRDE